MKSKIFSASGIAVTIGLFVGLCHGQTSSDSMVVVLKNDAVIIGEVTQTDDGISVRNHLGSATVFRLQQVAFLAESIDAAYVQLSNTLELSKPADLQRLFEWSLRNGQLDRSSELLFWAQSQKVESTVIQRMQRRIDSALAEKNPVQSQAASVASAPKTTVRIASQKEIDAAIKLLPDGTEAFFNQKLHARLISGCAAAKCHSRESESLTLWHDGKGVAVPRGYTRRNLHQVLQWVDRENPATSKLVEMAQTAHGGQTKPTFEPSEMSFQLLQFWTYAISQYPDKYMSEVVGVTADPSTSSASASKVPATTETPENVVAQVGFVEAQQVPNAPEQTKGTPASSVDRFVTDPCDPLLFNRTHHPDRVK